MELEWKARILDSAAMMNIRYIRLQFTDLFGQLKNVEIPAEQLENALDCKIMFDGSSIHGFARIEESDMYLVPDERTWMVLPWTPSDARVARLICHVSLPDGRPFAGDPRFILTRAVQKLRDTGLHPFTVSVELEFFLLELDKAGRPTLGVSDGGGYFDTLPASVGDACRRDIVMALQELGIPITSSHHETAPSQHELVLDYTDVIQAADYVSTLKMVAKNISRRYGLHATFMPKPRQDSDGSGMHCLFSWSQPEQSMSAVKVSEGQPFATSTPSHRELSFIAGLMFHAPAITAVGNPLVNSYKRLTPGYEAPAYVFWSQEHRMPFVRMTSDTERACIIELRSPDASSNPYLLFALCLHAGIDGLLQGELPPPPIHQSISEMSEEERFQRGITRLPANLEQAIEALEEDEVMREALGEHACNHYIRAKLSEWETYRKTVHPWELAQYLVSY